jgi:hypothetical protein
MVIMVRESKLDEGYAGNCDANREVRLVTGVIQTLCPRWPTAVTNPPDLQAPSVNTSATLLIVNALWVRSHPQSTH